MGFEAQFRQLRRAHKSPNFLNGLAPFLGSTLQSLGPPKAPFDPGQKSTPDAFRHQCVAKVLVPLIPVKKVLAGIRPAVLPPISLTWSYLKTLQKWIQEPFQKI